MLGRPSCRRPLCSNKRAAVSGGWWSWVQLSDRCFCVLVLVWFLRVLVLVWFLRNSLFVLVLGLGFKSRPVRFVVFCVRAGLERSDFAVRRVPLISAWK